MLQLFVIIMFIYLKAFKFKRYKIGTRYITYYILHIIKYFEAQYYIFWLIIIIYF